MREGITIEGAQAAKHQEATKSKWKFFFFDEFKSEWKIKKKESSTNAEPTTGKWNDG